MNDVYIYVVLKKKQIKDHRKTIKSTTPRDSDGIKKMKV